RLRICIDRYAADADASRETVAESVPTQLTLFDPGEPVAAAPDVPELPPLPPIEVPAERVGRLSYSALALYERCPYRFYAERIAGLRPVDGSVRENGAADRIDPVPNAVSTGLAPTDIVEAEYQLQRLVYAIACFRAGADEVEVVYQFLERPDELVSALFRRDDLHALEAELSQAIARIQAGDFPPRPSELACAG